jgi:hypothetical protein
MLEKELDIDKLVKLKAAGYRILCNEFEAWFFINPSGVRSVLFERLNDLIESIP